MIADPVRRGEALADFALATIPRLWQDLAEGARIPVDAAAPRHEWDCFALYACVRGLVAAGGFNRETGASIDAFHERVLGAWAAEHGDQDDPRRAMAAGRYSEYGAIGQDGGASGAASVERRLGEACARRLMACEGFSAAIGAGELAEMAGAIHEALSEGAAEAVRIAT